MPKVKDVKILLPEILKDIKSMDNVKSIYIWGSLAKNYNKPNFRVKDIDIIAQTTFDSGDLTSISDEALSNVFSEEELEEQGYDPKSIIFSKNFVKLKIDHWAISKDKKLLHWGAIPINKEEAEEINKEASLFAVNNSGCDRKKINKVSKEVRDNWYQFYYSYLSNQFKDMPSGWYPTDVKSLDKILKNTITL